VKKEAVPVLPNRFLSKTKTNLPNFAKACLIFGWVAKMSQNLHFGRLGLLAFLSFSPAPIVRVNRTASCVPP
jgi:hypothetical protein